MPQMVDNRYLVGEQLGVGGMGAVYRGRDTRLQRDVAIKRLNILGSQYEVDQFMKRFERESIAMAQLQHPNIVRVLDFGRDGEGIFLILEYMSGGSLKDKMTSPFDPSVAAVILSPIADALHYVHDQGMIHRDVKPANILFDTRGNPMLADFGIVKLVEDSPGATLTGTGVAIGTPTYMAPELIGGEFDHRVDQYALGIIFYEMVTGKAPYKGRTPMEAMVAHKLETLPDPRILRPDLSQEAWNLIVRVLAKDPDQRFNDSGQFSKALRGLGRTAAPEIHISPPVKANPTSDLAFSLKMEESEEETQLAHTPSQGLAAPLQATDVSASSVTGAASPMVEPPLPDEPGNGSKPSAPKGNPKKKWMAIISPILVIIGLIIAISALSDGGIFVYFGIFTVVVGVVVGVLGLKSTKKTWAIIAIILGGIPLLLLLLLLFLFLTGILQ